MAGLRSPGLRQVHADDATVALRLMVDRRAELGRACTEVVNRTHQMLLEILPGGAKKFLTRGQASYLLRTAPAPVGIVARTRHQLARELIDELTIIDAKIRAADKQLRELVTATGSSLAELNGIGPSGAARLIGDVGDIARRRPRTIILLAHVFGMIGCGQLGKIGCTLIGKGVRRGYVCWHPPASELRGVRRWSPGAVPDRSRRPPARTARGAPRPAPGQPPHTVTTSNGRLDAEGPPRTVLLLAMSWHSLDLEPGVTRPQIICSVSG